MRAVLYARVSTQGQAQDGLSLTVQEAEARAWCEANGHELVGVFVDVKSGRSWNRPRWQAMLAEAEQRPRPWDLLLVYRLDRLSRSLRDLLEGLGRLEDNGATWRSITQPELAGLTGRMAMGILGVVAEAESAATGARVRGIIRHRQERGDYLPTCPPFGYAYVPKSEPGGPAWVVVEEQAETVRVAFDLLPKLGSMRAVGLELLRRGHKPRTAKSWAPSVLAWMFRQTAYVGRLSVGKIEVVHEGRNKKQRRRPAGEVREVEGVVPAIVTQEAWDAAQEALAFGATLHPKRLGTVRDKLWAGLVRCSCGRGARQIGPPDQERWYCEGRRDGGASYPCDVPATSAAQLVIALCPPLAALVDSAPKGEVKAPRVPRKGPDTLARLTRAQEAYLAGALPLEALKEAQAQHEAALLKAPEPSTLTAPSLGAPMAELWRYASTSTRAALLRSLVAKVELHKDRVVAHLHDFQGWPATIEAEPPRGSSRRPYAEASKDGWVEPIQMGWPKGKPRRA